MLTPRQISDLYAKFGNSFSYRNFALAANAYYLMVTKRYTLSKAVREITGSSIGFRISDAISAGKYLFKKVNGRYVPLGYLATVTANVHGGGTLVFSLWFPFYYTDFYHVLRDVAHFITSSAGAFSYTVRVSPFINHGRFRIQQGNIIYEGTFRYQWGDYLCYFEIEIEKNCRIGRVIKRHSVMVNKCAFIPPLVPTRIQICLVVPPIRFVTEPWMISEAMIRRTYNELLRMLAEPNYDLFRIAILAYQLMVERDYSLSTATNYMSRLTGMSASAIRNFMIKSKLVVPGYPRRYPNRKYDPYGYEVTYSIFTKYPEDVRRKRSSASAMEVRFTIWQPFYSPIPFTNVSTVAEVLFNSLGSLGMPGESIILGIIRVAGGEDISDLSLIMEDGVKYAVRRMSVFRNRDKYTITLVKENGEGWRYDGIIRYQWEKDLICYLYIETLRLCAKSRTKNTWYSNIGEEAIITDRGFAGCDWVFDEHVRFSTNSLNFDTVCY